MLLGLNYLSAEDFCKKEFSSDTKEADELTVSIAAKAFDIHLHVFPVDQKGRLMPHLTFNGNNDTELPSVAIQFETSPNGTSSIGHYYALIPRTEIIPTNISNDTDASELIEDVSADPSKDYELSSSMEKVSIVVDDRNPAANVIGKDEEAVHKEWPTIPGGQADDGCNQNNISKESYRRKISGKQLRKKALKRRQTLATALLETSLLLGGNSYYCTIIDDYWTRVEEQVHTAGNYVIC